jgi:hypothetical protein
VFHQGAGLESSSGESDYAGVEQQANGLFGHEVRQYPEQGRWRLWALQNGVWTPMKGMKQPVRTTSIIRKLRIFGTFMT